MGQEESTRLANISMIQAKEEALAALLRAKQKIVSSSEANLELCQPLREEFTDLRVPSQQLPTDTGARTEPNLLRLLWNVRGLGAAGRRKLLVELVNKHSFDCICLQETIKTTFIQRDLDRFSGQKDMSWSWVPCMGHSRGMLMGVDKNLATVISEDQGQFFQSV